MTRRFRLSLFVCLAAAVGLHVRPCIVTLLHGGAPSAMDCGAVLELAGQIPEASEAPGAPTTPGSPASIRKGIPLVTVRPTLAAMLDAPALVGMRTAVAGGR